MGGEIPYPVLVGLTSLPDSQLVLCAPYVLLGESEFLNISAEYSDEEQTSRGELFNRTIAQSGLTPAESALVSGFFDHDGDPGVFV